MTSRINRISWLLIASCLCIMVCLAYVELCRDMTNKVQDPNHPEFWQVRNLALQWRNPASEARTDFADGDVSVFDHDQLCKPADHWIADFKVTDAKKAAETAEANVSMTKQASFGLGFLFGSRDNASQLKAAHQKFIESSTGFAMEYNRELTRLINNR